MVSFKKTLGVTFVIFLTLIFSAGFVYADEVGFGIVNGSDVNLRSDSDISSKGIEVLQKGNKVKIISQSEDWYKVSFSNKNGWIKKQYVSIKNISGNINGSDINLRTDSNVSSKILETLQKGNKVQVLDKDGEWYKISSPSKSIGWVKKQYVSIDKNIVASDNRIATSRGTDRDSSENIVSYAKQLIGVKYVWGGNSPDGFDCSGFASYVYKKVGINIDRVAADQAKKGSYVEKSNLKPGDLVFFDTNGGSNYINHVGIYLGEGKFAHASSARSKVIISNLNEEKTYMTARRY